MVHWSWAFFDFVKSICFLWLFIKNNLPSNDFRRSYFNVWLKTTLHWRSRYHEFDVLNNIGHLGRHIPIYSMFNLPYLVNCGAGSCHWTESYEVWCTFLNQISLALRQCKYFIFCCSTYCRSLYQICIKYAHEHDYVLVISEYTVQYFQYYTRIILALQCWA